MSGGFRNGGPHPRNFIKLIFLSARCQLIIFSARCQPCNGMEFASLPVYGLPPSWEATPRAVDMPKALLPKRLGGG